MVTKGEEDIEKCREGEAVDPWDEREWHVLTRPLDKDKGVWTRELYYCDQIHIYDQTHRWSQDLEVFIFGETSIRT